MKKNVLALIFVFSLKFAIAQKGLENIIVEKYYISNHLDTQTNNVNGYLPAGSVTYRIYVDMLPGYRFQAAYGVREHELRIATTTNFFNNQDFGGILPNIIPDKTLPRNTVMLDSWLSVGAASESTFGILKSKDTEIETIIHEKDYLQNDDKRGGIPVKVKDGLLAIDKMVPRVTGFGIDSLIAEHFGKGSNRLNGPVFSTTNGSWACLGGSIGPDSLDNQVLIAQITTNGDFSFELNLQLGTPEGGVENYVAKNPLGKEIEFKGLIYKSSALPVKFR